MQTNRPFPFPTRICPHSRRLCSELIDDPAPQPHTRIEQELEDLIRRLRDEFRYEAEPEAALLEAA